MQSELKISSISEIQEIVRLDTTHNGTTLVILGKFKQQLIICKCICKESINSQKQQEHLLNEKQALQFFTQQHTKGVNKLISTFQDQNNLYLIVEPVEGLPLHKLLQVVGNISQSFTRVIASQIALILKSMHAQGYIYRDVKASNFMVDRKGRVTLIDLGLKLGRFAEQLTASHLKYTKKRVMVMSFDYYSFGILLYQLLVGKAPFGYGNSNPHIKQDMKKGINHEQLNKIECPVTRDIINRLLQEQQVRLGSKGGFEQILAHDYFNCEQFLVGLDIYEGEGELEGQTYQCYLQEIEQLGLDEEKYREIPEDDPFYKFYNIA